MGVPGFFSWLLRNYKNKKDIITYDLPENTSIDNFYIDANCLFHPQCFKVIELLDDWKSESKLETKMMNRICNYLDYIINVVSPKKKVMISVDGVAPMAKMSQQRKRRYRSIDDLIIQEQIKERHNRNIKRRWSNTVITPGTEFMERLNQVLIKFIAKRKDIKIVYSSYHSAGEGEHKILDDIRECPDSDTHCIYGLDADLIFLAMASQKKNMYLLREVVKLGKVGKSIGDHYVHVDPVEDVQEEINFVSIN
jgi:5'-3' exonuclease